MLKGILIGLFFKLCYDLNRYSKTPLIYSVIKQLNNNLLEKKRKKSSTIQEFVTTTYSSNNRKNIDFTNIC